MDGDAAPDRDILPWVLQQAGVPHHKLAALAPDFLVVSPPKTGSTWLAANLRCHPGVFVPGVKEVKYFSSLHKRLDLGWYLDHFAPAGGRRRGEASPSYALLPVAMIRLIRRLFPDLRLVFLLREPISRAWSHARHNHRYREANFSRPAGPAPLAAVSERQWRENFTHDWPLASGDYLGQLRRWLSVFPRERVYVGYYESIARSPAALLRDIFSLLGLSADVDFSTFPLHERILPGEPGALSADLHRFLHGLLHARSRELIDFLREQWGAQPPPEWREVLSPLEGQPHTPPAEPFRRQFDDRYLHGVLEMEEGLPSSYPPILDDYRGFLIRFFRGRLFGLDPTLRPLDLEAVTPDELRAYEEAGRCFTAPSLGELKGRIDQHAYYRARNQVEALERRQVGLDEALRDARRHIDRLEAGLGEASRALRALEADALRLSPKERSLTHFLREAVRRPLRAYRRLRAAFAADRRAAVDTACRTE
jgi:hypothetical protein